MHMRRATYVLPLTLFNRNLAETTHSTTSWYTALNLLASFVLSACWTPSTHLLPLPGSHQPRIQLQTMLSQPMLRMLPSRLSIGSWRVMIAMLSRRSIAVSSVIWYSRTPWTSELQVDFILNLCLVANKSLRK